MEADRGGRSGGAARRAGAAARRAGPSHVVARSCAGDEALGDVHLVVERDEIEVGEAVAHYLGRYVPARQRQRLALEVGNCREARARAVRNDDLRGGAAEGGELEESSEEAWEVVHPREARDHHAHAHAPRLLRLQRRRAAHSRRLTFLIWQVAEFSHRTL